MVRMQAAATVLARKFGLTVPGLTPEPMPA
jgi:hypothetical protein